MTSALAMSSSARAVSRPGSPGPGADEVRGHGASDLARAGAQQPLRRPRRRARSGSSPSSSSRTQALPSARADERAQRAARRRREHLRVGAHRRVAVGLERAHERALGGQRPRRRGVVDRRDAATPRRRGWSRPGSPGPAAGTSSSSGVPASPRPRRCEPGGGQHDRVVVAVGELAQARVDVAAQLDDRRGRRAARAAGRRGAATTCPRARPRPARRATPRRTARRAGRRAAGTAAMTMPSGSCAGTSLAECTAQSTSPSQQRGVELAHPALLVGASRSPRSPLVDDLDQLVLAAEQRRHLARLRQGQRAAARPDPHARRLSGRTLSAAGASGAASAGGAGLRGRLVEPEQLAQDLLAAVRRSPSGGSSARAAAAA